MNAVRPGLRAELTALWVYWFSMVYSAVGCSRMFAGPPSLSYFARWWFWCPALQQSLSSVTPDTIPPPVWLSVSVQWIKRSVGQDVQSSPLLLLPPLLPLQARGLSTDRREVPGRGERVPPLSASQGGVGSSQQTADLIVTQKTKGEMV